MAARLWSDGRVARARAVEDGGGPVRLADAQHLAATSPSASSHEMRSHEPEPRAHASQRVAQAVGCD